VRPIHNPARLFASSALPSLSPFAFFVSLVVMPDHFDPLLHPFPFLNQESVTKPCLSKPPSLFKGIMFAHFVFHVYSFRGSRTSGPSAASMSTTVGLFDARVNRLY
jgi:hypothetical protein